ncbi:MAG: hypothetical protein Q7S36_02160 [Candidatus Liptonbacteria bacterium]|nr:hypothetical protein [Candidatus Liptonbacteria bacterium]
MKYKVTMSSVPAGGMDEQHFVKVSQEDLAMLFEAATDDSAIKFVREEVSPSTEEVRSFSLELKREESGCPKSIFSMKYPVYPEER